MNERQLTDLRRAVKLLENPSFGAKVADIVGTPIEKSIALLPNSAKQLIGKATQKSILAALKVAVKTLDHHDPTSGGLPPESSDWWHTAATMGTGAAGGAFGLLALTIELPVTTTIMMRSIADVARSEGANLKLHEIQLQCVSVLAMGGRTSSDDTSEVGYFVAREAMTRAVAEAAAYIAKSSLQKEGAPALVRLILAVAERFSILVTEKAAAQAVPIIGAIGGALINTVFMDHFQDMARGHFTVLRLESELGSEVVKANYAEMRRAGA
jgi:hypothetical protein